MMMKPTEYTRKNQPHFQHLGATFSITLMAHDAVPKIVLASLQEERKAALAQIATVDRTGTISLFFPLSGCLTSSSFPSLSSIISLSSPKEAAQCPHLQQLSNV